MATQNEASCISYKPPEKFLSSHPHHLYNFFFLYPSFSHSPRNMVKLVNIHKTLHDTHFYLHLCKSSCTHPPLIKSSISPHNFVFYTHIVIYFSNSNVLAYYFYSTVPQEHICKLAYHIPCIGQPSFLL